MNFLTEENVNIPPGIVGPSTTLLNLPDEVLLSIVDTCLDALDTHDLRMLKLSQLSHIFRKLRAVIIGFPKYWNTICSGLRTGDRMQAYLTRCAGIDIHVVLMDKHGDHACEALMKTAVGVSGRWKSFTLVLSSSRDMNYAPSLRRLDCHLLYLQLPRLRALRVSYGAAPMTFTPDFFTTWSFPGLRSMDVTNIVPKVAVMSLTSFSMTFANKKDSISLPMLQHFLESTTSLDSLSLTFENDTLIRIALQRIITVASLQSLRLKVENSKTEPICSVLRAFVFPKLNDLSIVARFVPGALALMMEMNDWKTGIFDACDSFYNVSSLALSLCAYGPMHGGILSPLSARFSRLKHFALETNLVALILGAEARGGAGEWPSAPLDSICFTECETLDIAWLRELKLFLEKRGHWEGLRKLRIEECAKIKHDEALEVVSKEKLEWSEKRSKPKEVFGETYAPRRAVNYFQHPHDVDMDMEGEFFSDGYSLGFWSENSDSEFGDDDNFMGHAYVVDDVFVEHATQDEGGLSDDEEDPHVNIPGAYIHSDVDEEEGELHHPFTGTHFVYAPDDFEETGHQEEEEDYDSDAMSDQSQVADGEGYHGDYDEPQSAGEEHHDDIDDHEDASEVDGNNTGVSESEAPYQTELAPATATGNETLGSEHGSEEHQGA